MKWERPEIIEIGMNAEIGGYQSDFDDNEPAGPGVPTLERHTGDVGTSDAS